MRTIDIGMLLLAAALVPAKAGGADPKSTALLKKAREASQRARSLTARVITSASANGKSSTHTVLLKLSKPNLATATLVDPDPAKRVRMVWTGKSVYLVRPGKKQYEMREAASTAKSSHLSNIGTPLAGAFFDVMVLRSLTDTATLTYGGRKSIDGSTYETVVVKRTTPAPLSVTAYFGASGLWEGAELAIPAPAGAKGKQSIPGKVRWWLRDLKLNATLPASEFAFTPPAGYTLLKSPVPKQETSER